MLSKTHSLYAAAKALIPGGTQLLSKRPELFAPGQFPAYFEKAKGAQITDLDGNSYIDMSCCGIGTTALGYADPDIEAAVITAIKKGSMCTLNCPEEVELAKQLCELYPWASQVRFSRSGGEAMAIAVRIARAHTRRDRILFCGYHGWHDWYISANLGNGDQLEGHLLPGIKPIGIPASLAGSAIPFPYNDTQALREIFAKHPDEVAAVVMEPARSFLPSSDYLTQVREAAIEAGAVLIFDEITSGWRMSNGGIHLNFNESPDIAVFAKALGNGYPMAAIIGQGKVMSSAEESFISSTYWTERIGPVAALAFLEKYKACHVEKHLITKGNQVKDAWAHAAENHGVGLKHSGIPPLSHFDFEHPQSQALATLFCQEMLGKGILAGRSFYAMYAHTDEHIQQYSSALDSTFATLASAIKADDVHSRLQGPVAHSGFKRLT